MSFKFIIKNYDWHLLFKYTLIRFLWKPLLKIRNKNWKYDLVFNKNSESKYVFFLNILQIPLLPFSASIIVSIILEKRDPIYSQRKVCQGNVNWPPLKWLCRLTDTLQLSMKPWELAAGGCLWYSGVLLLFPEWVLCSPSFTLSAPECVYLLL